MPCFEASIFEGPRKKKTHYDASHTSPGSNLIYIITSSAVKDANKYSQ